MENFSEYPVYDTLLKYSDHIKESILNSLKKTAYTRLMYYVFIEVEALSEMNKRFLLYPWEWARVLRNLKKINQLTKAFKDLPINLSDTNFDEEVFWNKLSALLSNEQAQYLKQDFEELISGLSRR
ncbi:hypothetical protein ACVNS2_10620 [Paenibacillus caseinilyticus]|uniref:Uncharacterized protein n=1 Tax=Paenibacillus mucilaginosus K02 TaxID=997761 RepID=I0BFF1_9BACL|nr:hypothetical protein [Paenibacillus mucilaginosus]AFH61098.1 hypothetical protein B2K_10240 [Paenibacillus mucilaginosus K02]